MDWLKGVGPVLVFAAQSERIFYFYGGRTDGHRVNVAGSQLIQAGPCTFVVLRGLGDRSPVIKESSVPGA